jgi:hypothetical protein
MIAREVQDRGIVDQPIGDRDRLREQLDEAAGGGGGEVELPEQLPYERDGIPRGGGVGDCSSWPCR